VLQFRPNHSRVQLTFLWSVVSAAALQKDTCKATLIEGQAHHTLTMMDFRDIGVACIVVVADGHSLLHRPCKVASSLTCTQQQTWMTSRAYLQVLPALSLLTLPAGLEQSATTLRKQGFTGMAHVCKQHLHVRWAGDKGAVRISPMVTLGLQHTAWSSGCNPTPCHAVMRYKFWTPIFHGDTVTQIYTLWTSQSRYLPAPRTSHEPNYQQPVSARLRKN
jgi:hypothetical protein